MATGAAWLSQRNTNLNTFNVTSITLNSTMVSLGASTNSVYTKLSQGNFASSISTSSWVSSLTNRVSTTTVAMSANAQYQLALTQSSISTSVMYTSTLGSSWSTLNGTLGLPNPNETSYTAGAVSGTGQYGVLGTSAGQLFVTSTFGQSFSGPNVNVPYVYLPFEGSITDRSGSNRTVTATGTFTYGTGIVGLYSAFFNNTSGNNTSSNYISIPWLGAPNFTITGWFNASSFSSGGFTPTIFATYMDSIKATLSNTGVLTVIVPSNGTSTTLATSPTLLLNTWYNYTFIFQTNRLCSFYLNNTLIGSITNVGGTGATATTYIYLGTNASAQNPFIGYMDDINIYTIAMPFTNLSSTTPVPTVYLPLDTVPANSSQSSGTIPATLTVVGPPTQAPSYVVGSGAVQLANTIGNVSATQYIRGSWSGATNFTVSFWFNTQLSTASVLQQVIFSAYGTSISITINNSNQLVMAYPSGTGAGQTTLNTLFSIATNTWYNITFIFQTGSTCYLYVNNSLIITFVNVGIGAFTSSAFGIGAFDVGSVVYGFNGYIDDFKIYNSAISLPPVSLTLPTSPTIYIPGDTAPIDGSQSLGTAPVTLTVIGQPTLASSYAAGLGAINLANTPTGTAVQYIKGPWSGATNFTVSLLINPQSAAASMIIFAIGGALQIQTNGTSGLQLQAPGISVSTAYAITTNTWYNITVIFQANSVCSFYVNNVLIAQPTSTGSISSGQFALGTYDTGTSNAFNGFIDDFRLYNTAIPLTTLFPTSTTMPAIYISGDTVPTTGSSSSGTAPVMLTVTGTPTQAPSYVVGSGAISLANTAGSASPTQYIRGPWVVPPAFTISLWFNIQQLNGTYQVIFSALSFGIELFIDPSNRLVGQIPTGSGTGQLNVYTAALTTNIWYNAVLTCQVGGTSSMYLNNAFVGNFPVNTGLGTWGVTNTFALGTYDNSLNYAFNGYIDDFKIYNTIIPITNQFPSQPFTSIAVSNSGQYMLAAMANQCLYMSSNYGITFTPITGALLSALWSNAQISSSGQYMMAYAAPQIVSPQLTGLLGNTTSTTPVYISWTTNGITWTSFCSTNNNSAFFQSWVAFNNIGTGSTPPYSWASNAIYTAGVYNGIVSTIIQSPGPGVYLGEWIQLQSSVPLVMYSYNFACGGTTNIPKTYYIVGSNDGTVWYPIQSVSMNQTPFTGNFTSATSAPIIVNQSGTQTMTAGATGTLTCSTFATTNVAYTYFRFIANSLFSTGSNFEFEELYLNFQAGGQIYSANYGTTWSNYMPIYTTIQPQLTGIASSTTALTTAAWQTNGVTWIARASSLQASNPGNWPVSFAFDTTANAQWNSVDGYDSSGNPTIAPIKQTIVSGSTINGEWLQLQSSVPLVMNSYKIGSGGFWQYPKSYTIAGSNDNGSTWFTIQTVTFASNPSGGTNQLIPNTLIVVAQSGIQPVVTSAATANATCIPGANSTTAFTYFRIIAQSIFSNGSNSCLSIGEWVINFVGGALSTHALSESGQYQLAVNATPSPTLLTQLNFENTAIDSAGGLTYRSNVGSALSYSSSIYKVGTTSLFCNNVPAGATAVGGGALSYFNYTVPAALALPSALTISFWINPNSTAGQSCPIGFNNGGSAAGPYFYLASTMIFAYYTSTAQSGIVSGISTVPVGSWTHIALTFTNGLLALYINGALQATLSVTGTLSLDSSGSWGAITNMFVGCIYTLGGGYQGYIDDIRIYTVALNAAQIYTLYATTALTPAIYITQNFNTNTLVLPTITPALNASTNVPVASAVSNTGQYMLFITNNTAGNNVYYSMNYGATFTGLTLGTTALTSCAISYDGTYMTIASGATVYTLNNNSTGFSVALGNQAGAQNQANNAIAIGNYAGYQNQTANSIILNASGQGLNAITQGFYVSPIASYTASSAQTISLLGYGTDNQVVQTALMSASGNLTVPLGNLAVSSGNLGVGTTNPTTTLTLWNQNIRNVSPTISMYGYSDAAGFGPAINFYAFFNAITPQGRIEVFDAGYYGGNMIFSLKANAGTPLGPVVEYMRITEAGRVGIGKTNPSQLLDVNGAINCTSFLVNGTAVATGTGSVWGVNGSTAYYTSGSVGIGTINTGGTILQLYGTSGAGGTINQYIINTTTTGFAQIWLISGGNAGSPGGGLFLNGPARSVDGGVNTLTLRNDAGDLKLAASGDSPYMYVKSATGIGIGMNAPSNLLTVGPAVSPGANSAGTTQLVVYGNINCFRNRLIFSNALTDWNHSIYNNANNLDNEGVWDGMKFNVYQGAWFRVGNASGVTPTTALFIDSAGKVGIGTTNPINTLHLYSTGATGLAIATNTSTNQLQLGIANGPQNYSTFAATGDSVIRAQVGNLMLQSGSGGAAIYINTNNNVGIGTNNPSSIFHIGTANPRITIGSTIYYPITTSTYGPDTSVIKPSTDIYGNANTGTNGGTIVYGKRLTISAGDLDGAVYNSGTNCVMVPGDLYLSGGSYNNWNNNGTGFVTQYGGSVFIQTGTTGPSGNPTLYGGVITFATQTNMSSQTVTEVMRISSNGNVGIGTNNPTAKLDVRGSLAKSSGTFDIAHPLHPTTKRLVHSFIEGPRCDLIYRGTVALTNGVATVDINRQCTHNQVGAMEHGTFEALCANPDVFLQNRTGFGRVIGTIQGAVLTITCENNTATDLISWMVVAERADSFIKQWDRTDDDGFLITEYSQ